MSTKNFVRKYEVKARENIDRANIDIQLCYKELDILNEQLILYMNRIAGRNGLTYYDKQTRLNEIRERIPEIYEHIKFYKECIEYEKNDMKRLYKEYGYQATYDYFDIYTDENIEEDFTEEYDDIVENKKINPNEETQDYKYNPETGMFE